MSEAKPQSEASLKARLYSKVVDITAELGQVKAEGHNEHSGYDFVGYEQVNARLRTLLPKHKLAIVPQFHGFHEQTFTINNKIAVRTIVNGSVLLVDLETGYAEERAICGADQDLGGKSGGQAVTEAVKRFELKLFHVSTKADIDPDSKTTELNGGEKNQDPIEFIRQHPDLKELAHGIKGSELKSMVVQEKFNHDKVKAALEAFKNF